MPNKLTSKNQFVPPKSITAAVASTNRFDIQARGNQNVSPPVCMQHSDAVRDKLVTLELGETDIAAAVAWSRKRGKFNTD